MMTVAEAELVRRAAEKGRSASFCAPSQPLSALHSAHSSSDIDMDARAHAAAFLQAQQQASSSPRARLKSTSSARRSQSCKVQGSRPPRVRRRESPRGSDLAIQLDEVANAAFARCAAEQQQQQLEDASYNPFLRKVPSCGRLVTLAPDGGASGEDAEGSPVLRRTASARRPRPQNGSSPNHSPTPTRVVRPSQKSRSTKRPSANASGGSRRGGGGGGGGGGGTSYLDVKPSGSNEGLDDSYLLRSFATTTKGIINRGDSFRRRRSRSNSIQPPMEGPLCGTPPNIPSSLDLATPPQTPDHSGTTPTPQQVATPDSGGDSEPVSSFRMAILGATGVGKTALIHQFRTSECINAYDCNASDESEQPVSIMLNNMESEIVFVNLATPQDLQNEMSRSNPPDGWMIVYSITDKASFQRAGEDLSKLNSNALLRGRAVILVGNKCELVRSRAVSIDDGRDLACSYGGKFMEISVGMNHRCDELLVGVLNQLRLKGEMEPDDEEEAPKERSWTRNRSLMRASMKAKRVINRIMGKTEAKYKNCEDFQS
ncbi:GTP-binding protein REM 2-like isoform X2 [Macrobrachium nipponense]|uniref:GTP-binding protein REM 2-like isoform X2 n=1 Tax=Macrobrachium nipponense TaxID=159736 RepID=UPI0030C81C35